jgi:hypothetical protein
MIPNPEKCTKRIQNVLNGHKISQISIKYLNIFQSKAPKIYPNWDFGFENKPSGNPGRGGNLLHVSATKDTREAIYFISRQGCQISHGTI